MSLISRTDKKTITNGATIGGSPRCPVGSGTVWIDPPDGSCLSDVCVWELPTGNSVESSQGLSVKMGRSVNTISRH